MFVCERERERVCVRERERVREGVIDSSIHTLIHIVITIACANTPNPYMPDQNIRWELCTSKESSHTSLLPTSPTSHNVTYRYICSNAKLFHVPGILVVDFKFNHIIFSELN